MRQRCSVRYAAIVLLVLLVLLASCRRASSDPESSRLLAASAVVLVRVANTSANPVTMDPFGGLHMAQLDIEAVIIDDGSFAEFEIDSLAMLYRSGMSHTLDFHTGKSYLIYLGFCWNGPKVVGDYRGAAVQDERASNMLKLPNGRVLDLSDAREYYSPFFSDNRKAERDFHKERSCGVVDPGSLTPFR